MTRILRCATELLESLEAANKKCRDAEAAMNAEKHVLTEFALEKSDIEPKVPVEEPTTVPKQSLGGGSRPSPGGTEEMSSPHPR